MHTLHHLKDILPDSYQDVEDNLHLFRYSEGVHNNHVEFYLLKCKILHQSRGNLHLHHPQVPQLSHGYYNEFAEFYRYVRDNYHNVNICSIPIHLLTQFQFFHESLWEVPQINKCIIAGPSGVCWVVGTVH